MGITVRDFKKIVEFNLDNDLRRVILGLGAPGIGKSEIMQQITAERGMGFIDLRLLLFSETDLKGVPFPDRETRTTDWLPNKILPDLTRDKPEGVLLLEELTSASKRVQLAAYQLIQDYRLGEYVVPKGWKIVALGNREDDDGVFVQMPSPLANRMQIHEVDVSFDVWKEDYAYKHSVNPKVIAYLNFSSKDIHTQEPGQHSMCFASPRSWTAVSDILNSSNPLESSLTRIQIEGNIGPIVTAKFMDFLKHEDQLPDINSIIAGKMLNVPKDQSLLFLLCSSLVERMKDLFREKSWEQLNNCINFLCGMPPEFMALGLRDFISLDKVAISRFLVEEVDSPEFILFMQNNKFLFE